MKAHFFSLDKKAYQDHRFRQLLAKRKRTPIDIVAYKNDNERIADLDWKSLYGKFLAGWPVRDIANDNEVTLWTVYKKFAEIRRSLD